MNYHELKNNYMYLRSMRRLIEMSDRYWPSIEKSINEVFDKEFGNELKIKDIINELKKRGVGPEVSYAERKSNLNVFDTSKKISEDEKKAQDYMAQGARLNRAKNWQWRLQVAISEAVKDNWYPMFGTYTVDEKRLPNECLTRDDLWTKTPAWDRFVKKFKTEIADKCGYGRKPEKWPKGETFFKYMAIIEHGKTGGHPHVHVIWLCKDIPKKWKVDPNQNNRHYANVDIPGASALWSHGQQRCTMGLFMCGSWFTENWKIPINQTSGEPQKIGGAGSVAGYIGKYLTKGETKKWNHRVKATKSLGLKDLYKKLKEMQELSLLLGLAVRPMEYQKWMGLQMKTSIPLGLLREKSKETLLIRLHGSGKRRGWNYLKETWTKRPQKFYTSLMQSVKDGAKPWKDTPEQRYSLFTQIMEEVKGTVHSKKQIYRMEKWLCKNDPLNLSSQTYTLLKADLL